MTISYLSRNNLIVHSTKSVAMIKGFAPAPTLGPQGPLMQVTETTTQLGVIQTANPEDTTRPPGDGPIPTANPTTGPEGSQTHTDHRDPRRGKRAHT